MKTFENFSLQRTSLCLSFLRILDSWKPIKGFGSSMFYRSIVVTRLGRQSWGKRAIRKAIAGNAFPTFPAFPGDKPNNVRASSSREFSLISV